MHMIVNAYDQECIMNAHDRNEHKKCVKPGSWMRGNKNFLCEYHFQDVSNNFLVSESRTGAYYTNFMWSNKSIGKH